MQELIRPLETIEINIGNKSIILYPDCWLICKPTSYSSLEQSYLLYDMGAIFPKIKISTFLRDNYFVNKAELRDIKLNELI